MADAMDVEDYYGSDTNGDEEGLPSSSNAYKRAFGKIMNKSVGGPLGPVLAARKQLVAKKLDEVAEDYKNRTEKRKHNQEIREKGHVLPDTFADSKEMALRKLATKGVVKLFNAVTKAQKVQAGSESLKSGDAKALVKQTKAAFMSELKGENKSKYEDSEGIDEKPGWLALQDNFMLGGSKLKDWDKQQDDSENDESEEFGKDSSGSED